MFLDKKNNWRGLFLNHHYITKMIKYALRIDMIWHLTIDCVRFWDTKEVNGVSINSKYWIKKDDLGIILGINNINA